MNNLQAAPKAFVAILRRALQSMYDPTMLRRSPLLALLGATQRAEPVSALRATLTEAIKTLKPPASVPPTAQAWRLYRILHYRYIEQLTQGEVARDLALSIRQLRRQETVAVQALADDIWKHHQLSADMVADVAEPPESPVTGGAGGIGDSPARGDEMAWLKSSAPREPADLALLLESILTTLGPLIRTEHASVIVEAPQEQPLVMIQTISVRQALLNITADAIRGSAGGQVTVKCAVLTASSGPAVGLQIAVRTGEAVRDCRPQLQASSEVARQLLELSGGRLEFSQANPGTAHILLPAVQHSVVLAVDDNRDTLQLIQRSLVGTRYTVVATDNPAEVFSLAGQWSPVTILIDVMLPGIDGWELLARLREHPRTAHIPLVVCSILPESELAFLLGAADFLPKPVRRQALLATLDRLTRSEPRQTSSLSPRSL